MSNKIIEMIEIAMRPEGEGAIEGAEADVAEAVAEDTPRNKSKRRIGEHNKREKEEAKTKKRAKKRKRAMMMTMKKTHHPETRKKKKKKKMTMVRRLSR